MAGVIPKISPTPKIYYHIDAMATSSVDIPLSPESVAMRPIGRCTDVFACGLDTLHFLFY